MTFPPLCEIRLKDVARDIEGVKLVCQVRRTFRYQIVIDFHQDFSFDFEERSDDPFKKPTKKRRTGAHFLLRF